MKDKCIERIIELYFKDFTVKQAIAKVKKECSCGKCNLNCCCNKDVNIVQEKTSEGQYKINFLEVNMRDIALEIVDLVEKKNSDYGNSFEDTLKKYGDAAYFMRIEDKLSRLKSLVNKDGQINESQEDTLKDIIGYTLLMIDCKRNKNKKDLRIRGFEKISKKQFEEDFVEFNVDYEDIKLPRRSTKWSAGYDIFSPVRIELEPGQDIKLPTGLRAYMRDTEYLEAVPRSGQGFKYYLRLANTVGIIDADYRFSDNEGHFYVKLRNEGNKKVVIEKGVAMFQVIFKSYLLADGDSTKIGEIRNGGFGSTGGM